MIAIGGLVGERPAVDAISSESWLALGYLVVFGSLLAFTAYVWLLSNASISLTATYAYVNPVVAVALGAVLLGETITGPMLLGGAVVVAAVAIVVATESR
jgi:drug/metabolite transporter (DMT)-like permease